MQRRELFRIGQTDLLEKKKFQKEILVKITKNKKNQVIEIWRNKKEFINLRWINTGYNALK